MCGVLMAKITVKFVRYSCYKEKYNRRKSGALMGGKDHNSVSEKMMRCVM